MTTEKQAAQNLCKQAMQESKESTVLLMLKAANRLDSEVNVTSLHAAWIEKWLGWNKDRQGANYE